MTLTVWVDDWQLQCCGGFFVRGDRVAWTLVEADAEDYAEVLGPEHAAVIDFREEHHGQEKQQAPSRLEVLGIVEVYCQYEVSSASATNMCCPVPGTTVLVPVAAADGWPKARPDVRLVGCLVTARRATDAPVRPAPKGEQRVVAGGPRQCR